MLVVPIYINSDKIAELRLQRLTDIRVGDLNNDKIPCKYKAEYYNESHPCIEFEITHDYHLGCESLIEKAMRRVKQLKNEKGYKNPKSDISTHMVEFLNQVYEG